MKKQIYTITALAALAGLVAGGCIVRGAVYAPVPPAVVVTEPAPYAVVSAPTPPPVPQTDVFVAAPGPNYAWTAGYWNWNGAAWVWLPGRWVIRPWHGAVWVGGFWDYHHGRGHWIAGHWRQIAISRPWRKAAEMSKRRQRAWLSSLGNGCCLRGETGVTGRNFLSGIAIA